MCVFAHRKEYMIKQRFKLLLSPPLGGLLANQVAACSTPPSAPAAAAPAQQATAAPAPAVVSTFSDGITAIGEMKPIQDANLTFQVVGTVAQVLVKDGDTVKKDQLLAVLDT